MNGTPQPSGLRFVACIPPCENTVIQHLDAESHWRPDPPLCDACKAENARQAAEWARQAHPVRPYEVTVLVKAEDAVSALVAAGDILLTEGAAQLAALGDDVIQVREVMT